MRIAFITTAALALVAVAAAPPPALHDMDPTKPGKMYAEGSIPELADAFTKICLAHPLDVAEQRRTAGTPPFHMTRETAATTIESYTGGLLQLSVNAGPTGNLCAMLTPFVNLPTMADATRDLRAKLHLVGPGQVQGGATAWTRTVGQTREIIGLSFTHQGANHGAVLTLSAKKV